MPSVPHNPAVIPRERPDSMDSPRSARNPVRPPQRPATPVPETTPSRPASPGATERNRTVDTPEGPVFPRRSGFPQAIPITRSRRMPIDLGEREGDDHGHGY